MRSSTNHLLAFLALAALGACGKDDADPVSCSTEARGSVNLTVVDEAAAPIAGATATWSLGGGEAQPCDGMPDGVFVCGWEVDGDLLLRVEAEGYESAEQVVTVEADECHVLPEVLTLTLLEEQVDCTEQEVPSIEVTVAGSSGEPLDGVSVTYAPLGGDDAAPCELRSDASWICGSEEAGDFVVTAVAGGHVPESAGVTVEADECHVITETVDFLLDWGAD